MHRFALALALVPFAQPGFAADPRPKSNIECTIEQGSQDLVTIGRDAIIEPGGVAQKVVVIDGNLLVKKGARAKSVLVSNGSVTIEAGAQIDGSVITIGGKSTVARKTDVKESVITLDDGLKIIGDNGDGLSLNITIDGKSLGEKLVDEVLKELRGCKIVKK
ncbi:MAG: hypothetical protein QM817_13890 [Archangium sp.]